MSEDFNWEQAEEAVARARTTFEEYAPTAEEAEQRRRKDQKNRLWALEDRMGIALCRLYREAWGKKDALNYKLDWEIETFRGQADEVLSAMPPNEAAQWIVENLGTIERLHADTDEERYYTLRALASLGANLARAADHLEEASTPTPTAHGAPTTTDDEIPWSDGDDEEEDEEEEFHAAATREIVAAYRNTAICIRDNLIARFRGHAQRLGLQAAEHSPNPWRYGLNNELGRLMGHVEVFLRGINPLEAQSWLESNIEEFESLKANTPREYDQAAQALSGLSDRLVGLLYEIAREK